MAPEVTKDVFVKLAHVVEVTQDASQRLALHHHQAHVLAVVPT